MTETTTRQQHTRRTMNEHKSEQKMKMKSEQDEDERDGNVGLAYHKTLLSTRTIVDGEHSVCWK